MERRPFSTESLILLVVALVFIVGLPRQGGAVVIKTACIGNNFNCYAKSAASFDISRASAVRYLGVRWDGDKIRGMRFEFLEEPFFTVGDYSAQYALSTINFAARETLRSLSFKDSGYGHNSLRRIELTTSSQSFSAGPDGYDNVVPVSAVLGTTLGGFFGIVNPDNFMQALGAYIVVPNAPPASGVVLRTSFIGNSQHAWEASAGFDHQLNNIPIQWLGVRWDGDKVRGLSFRLFDGSQWTQGDFSKQYAFSEIAFVPGETLSALTLIDSAYGYGSLRQIKLTTSSGQVFTAGTDPNSGHSSVSPPVMGGTLVGFYGLVNVDVFMQALGAHVAYPGCETANILEDIDDPTASQPLLPITDLALLESVEQWCVSAAQAGSCSPGNRRLLLEASKRRSLVDRITPIPTRSALTSFSNTVARWTDGIAQRASGATSEVVSVRGGNALEQTQSWRIDRQAVIRPTTADPVDYNLYAVQANVQGGTSLTYASVRVPTGYNIGVRRIRRAFHDSQNLTATVTITRPVGAPSQGSTLAIGIAVLQLVWGIIGLGRCG